MFTDNRTFQTPTENEETKIIRCVSMKIKWYFTKR